MSGAIAAAFAGVKLSLVGGHLAERGDVLVIDLIDLVPAKAALGLFTEIGFPLAPARAASST